MASCKTDFLCTLVVLFLICFRERCCFSSKYPYSPMAVVGRFIPPPLLSHQFHYHPTTHVSGKSSFSSHSPLRILVLKAPSRLSEFPTTLHVVDMNINFLGPHILPCTPSLPNDSGSNSEHFLTAFGAHNEKIFLTWFKIFILHIGRVHRRVHQEEKPHKCDVEGCDKAFKTPAELSRHAFRHTGEKPHKCDQCDKAFIRYDDLKRHYRIHTGRYFMYYNCTVCTC